MAEVRGRPCMARPGRTEARCREGGTMDREPLHGTRMMRREAELPTRRAKERQEEALALGLESAASVRDRTIPLFNRTNWRMSNSGTYLSAPFLRDMRELGGQDVAVVGVPLDTGTTFRSGTRWGPGQMRSVSAL